MSSDRLDALLRHFQVDAKFFHAGPLCGLTEERGVEGQGHLHVIQRGRVEVEHEEQATLLIHEPTLLFYPRPLDHSFRTHGQEGADLVCATVAFRAGPLNPVVRALPRVVVLPLRELPSMQATFDLLFEEASAERAGRQTALNCLFELLLIQLLRKIVDQGLMSSGMLAGLAHPQIGKALVAVHETPSRPWTIETLAAVAGMSRSRLASTFKATVGATVGDYLCDWRIALAQQLLRRDFPLKQVASEVGYGSPVALARVFKSRVGSSPRVWLRAEDATARLWSTRSGE